MNTNYCSDVNIGSKREESGKSSSRSIMQCKNNYIDRKFKRRRLKRTNSVRNEYQRSTIKGTGYKGSLIFKRQDSSYFQTLSPSLKAESVREDRCIPIYNPQTNKPRNKMSEMSKIFKAQSQIVPLIPSIVITPKIKVRQEESFLEQLLNIFGCVNC